MDSTLLTERQAAELLGLSPSFLRKHRQTGEGPSFVRISARCIRYREADLEAWIDERLRSSTAEVRA